ncbi:MAG: hypothetical protein ABIG39_07015 [Candidatus Micrarchaeota archaeon]
MKKLFENKKVKTGTVLGAASTISMVGIGVTMGYVCPFCVIGLMASGTLIGAGMIENALKKK